MSKIAELVHPETRSPHALRGVVVFGYRRELRLIAPIERCSIG
ncbi:hypothetical protein [Mycetocola zhadangensis]|nr:hypothetical protein [Mycetocola zhadangensis]